MVSYVNHVRLTREPTDFQAVCVDTLKSEGLAKNFLDLGSVDRWQCHGSLPNRLQWQACKSNDTWLWTASDFAILSRAAFVSCAGHETCCTASKSASSSFRIVQGRTCRASASAGPSIATVKALVLLALAVAGMTEALNRYLRKLQRIADEHGVAVVITNQASSVISILPIHVYVEMEGGLHLPPLSN